MTTYIKMSCVIVLVVLLAVTMPKVEAVTCGQVVGAVAPCLGYLRNGGSPPPACCNGIKGLMNQARTRANRRTICKCLQGSSSSYRGVSGNYAATLPAKCGVTFPYKISPSVNCNRIQ
ncbi:hypothetical protein R6Q57_004265 [Mikania cordata]